MGKLRTTYYNCNMSTSLLATFSTCLFLGGATEFVFWWKKLTSHWVEAAQCVQVSRWGSCCLLKELQIKLDITPKNKTRVRVRAGSASGRNCITPQPERRHKGNSPCPCTKSQQSVKKNSSSKIQPEHHQSENQCCPCTALQPKQHHNAFPTQDSQYTSLSEVCI